MVGGNRNNNTFELHIMRKKVYRLKILSVSKAKNKVVPRKNSPLRGWIFFDTIKFFFITINYDYILTQ